ncbi:hypothetical protein RHGRI_003556 [Rhododendron griersonianum]|uniref:Cellulose synthase-like protein G2 n=1 Tax=Rhododendron griersonianum TaxID=479676 RepID=A0AAV6L6C9_9ERIC|nr:hypothetical protein RHGRI_003556 [Rhododendron griersonianum]
MDNTTLPLHLSHVQKSSSIINRSHTLLHSTALIALIYYRIASFFLTTKPSNLSTSFSCLLVFTGELILSFIWFLGQAYRFRTVTRTVFPERLPENIELPAVDVFICTADPSKEPTLEVMNTVISAIALDYPPDKLHVYLSDDGGYSVTLEAMKEAWRFAKGYWVPFCRAYGIKTRCPEAYFLGEEGNTESSSGSEFMADRERVKEKYENFKSRVMRIRQNSIIVVNRDHTAVVEVGFLYLSVAEDYFTGLVNLHCKGWKSVYCDPVRHAFLGASTTNLNDVLVQSTRWSSGLVEVALSRFCPLIYGPKKMSALQTMCYGELAFFPFYFFPLWCFAIIPQLCLLNGIAVYPEASNWFFIVFSFVFLSSLSKHIQEVLSTGGSMRSWINEQRMWMIRSVTCYLYGSLDAIMKRLGMKEANFMTTNKVIDVEQTKLYQMGKIDFQTSIMLLAPLVILTIINVVSFVGGVTRAMVTGKFSDMFIQVFLSLFIVTMGYPVIEGMILRKDKGRIPPSVTILSVLVSTIFLSLGSLVLSVLLK